MNKTKHKLGIVIFAGAVTCLSTLSYADVTSESPPSESISRTSTTSLLDTISKYGTLSYLGFYRGGSLNDLSSSFQPAVDGTPDPTNPQSFENFVITAYKPKKDVILGVTWHFNYFPVGNPVGQGQDLQMLDPLLTFTRNNWIDKNGFKLSTRLYGAIPVSSADLLKPNNMITYLQPTGVASYEIPHTDLTIGLFTYIRGYIHSATTPDNARTYKFYVAPSANYQISKTVAATLWVDLIQSTRNGGTGFFSGMTNASADIEPGINWDITPNISINPILNIYPAHPTLASTSLQAILIAKAF